LKRELAETKSFWDANPCGGDYGSYDDFMTWIQDTEPYAFEIMSRISWIDKRVLDVGCGQGTMVNYLPRFGATMFGLDLSPVSLHRAAAGAHELGYSDRVHLSAANAERLPFPNDCFDTVLSMGVLHHTENTTEGVREIWRVLKPGGLALVMFYRSGNPKWWMTRLIRTVSSLVDRIAGEPYYIANRLRPKHEEDDVRGTALLELFGCPILKAFSNRQVREMFRIFPKVLISNYQPGFRRLADIVPMLRSVEFLLEKIDRRFTQVWGFYQVIQAWK
jgi:ubiquinone/menaquinone biosynthesis C-methylase UbiE